MYISKKEFIEVQFLMKLTTKGRYAVTAMLDLTLNATTKPVSLSDISMRQGISVNYLEQLFMQLKKSNLVISVRGPTGGYKLGRNSQLIFIDQVIDAVNECVDVTKCKGGVGCQQGIRCLTHNLWDELSKEVRKFFQRISLEGLSRQTYVQQTCKKQLKKQHNSTDITG